MKISTYYYPNGIIVRERGSKDLRFSQAEEAVGQPLNAVGLQKTEKSGQQKLEAGKGNILWYAMVLGERLIHFLKSVLCMWKCCFDKLQQEKYYILGNLGRENESLEYSVEVVLKVSFRISKVGIPPVKAENSGTGWGQQSVFSQAFQVILMLQQLKIHCPTMMHKLPLF